MYQKDVMNSTLHYQHNELLERIKKYLDDRADADFEFEEQRGYIPNREMKLLNTIDSNDPDMWYWLGEYFTEQGETDIVNEIQKIQP